MKLTELSPRWLINEPGRQLFIFHCPHCRQRWLSCKNVAMSVGDQIELFEIAMREEVMDVVVPTRDDMAWTFKDAGSWDTISITPSINAEPSGDWHGHITAGAIVGGI